MTNREKTFKRDLELSQWLRRAAHVRHLDIDHAVWVQQTEDHQLECFVAEECHLSGMDTKPTSFTRKMAQALSEYNGHLCKAFLFGTWYNHDRSELLFVRVRRLDQPEPDKDMDSNLFMLFLEHEAWRVKQ